jgi:hypothetical protein
VLVAVGAILLPTLPTVLQAQLIQVIVTATHDLNPGGGTCDYDADLPARDSHYNWQFESSGGGVVQVGQFACGSYWVAPANGDNGVSLLSLTGNPQWNDLISCDADPVTESHGLLSGANNYGSYNASENILPNLPVTLTPAPGSCISLVAMMQRNEWETTCEGLTNGTVGEAADSICVVTVMPSPPPDGGSNMIRPNITGSTKEFLTWSDFDLNRLQEYGFLAGWGYDLNEWQSATERWRHSTEIFSLRTFEGGDPQDWSNWNSFSEGGRAFRSSIITDEYLSYVNRNFMTDFFALLSPDSPLQDKRATLAAMLAYGLDLYHGRYDYGSGAPKAWSSGAGQWFGQFFPPALLAALETDPARAHQLKELAVHAHSSDPSMAAPNELRQIKRGVTGVLLWGDQGDPYGAWANLRDGQCFDSAIGSCNTNTGSKTEADPHGFIDGPMVSPGSNYMLVTLSRFQAFAAAMILLPEIRDTVNSDAPIEYVDRVLRHGLWTAPDPVAPPSLAAQNDSCSQVYNCAEWQITWGPDPVDERFAIEDGTGRFTQMNGTLLDMQLENWAAANNWSSIMALYDGDTYEDNAVSIGTVVRPDIVFESGFNPRAHLRCATPDAEIRYTLDGTVPTASSLLYTAPFSVSDGTVVRARAFLTGYISSDSRTKTFDQSGGDITDPTPPTNLNASNITSTAVDLDWNPSSDDVGVVGYNLYVSGILMDDVPSTSVTVMPLNPSTTYSFAVTAFDAAGNESAPSAAASVTTAASGATNLAFEQSVAASSVEDTYLPANSVDGNGSTRWSSEFTDNEWIYIDLGQTVSVERVVLDWEAAYGAAYHLQVSFDANTWTTVYTESSGNGGVDDISGLSVTGRYVRMLGIDRGTQWGYSLYEFEVWGAPVNTVNLSIGKPGTASSVQYGYVANNAFDGNGGSRWGSGYSDNEWIYVDLGAVYTITEISLDWEGAYGAVYDLQVSDDALSWTTVFSETSGDGGVDEVDGLQANGRYVRMLGIDRGTSYGYSLWEFEVGGF